MKKPIALIPLLACSFGIFNLGNIVHETVSWTDHIQGLLNGLISTITLSIAWALTALPWCFLVHFIYKWCGWMRFRVIAALLPSVLFCCVPLGLVILRPPNPQERFLRFANTPLPVSVRDLVYHHEGGGLADYGDVYYFRCSQEDAQALIRALGADLLGGSEVDWYASFRPLPGAPDFHTWKGRRIYQRYDEKKRWFYQVVTDASETQVYVSLSCI